MSDYENIEDIVSDEGFISWFLKENTAKAREWETWMLANPSKASLVHQAVDFIQAFPAENQRISSSEINQQLAQTHTKLQGPVILMKRRRLMGWVAAAASVVFIIGFFVFRQQDVSNTQLSTGFAKTSTDILSDGSVLTLNANSTARFSKAWKEGCERELWLQGEGFFKVAKTKQKDRFVVHTDKFDVIVTGTEFNVVNRPGNNSVYLAEGSVTVRDKSGTELKMLPGDYISIIDGQLTPIAMSSSQVLAWKENKISFSNTPLTDVIRQIADHYGVSIQLSNPAIGKKTLTGIMPNNDLDDLLKAIQLAINVRISRTGDKIILSENN
jgi:transmembrane sensor